MIPVNQPNEPWFCLLVPILFFFLILCLMPTETIRGHWDRWNWRDIKQVASHRCGFLTTKSSLQAPYTQTSPELAKDVTETNCCWLRWTWLSILPHSGFPTTANTECINLWSRNQNTLLKNVTYCACVHINTCSTCVEVRRKVGVTFISPSQSFCRSNSWCQDWWQVPKKGNIFLCSLETFYVDQTGLKLKNPPASASSC